ncbi:MAG: TIGR04211 family SH3 domain-containing protein [Pseudomonadales bacterium]|nr:TIGR04211 family SH3 domain-containing protein [Pseudomonadales bacterium]
MNKYTQKIVIAITLMTLGSHGFAEDRYVTDKLKLNLRTGASSKHKIIRQLRSSDKVELLATDESGEFALVRTTRGQEGWALIGYLQKSPTAAVTLKATSDKLETAQTKLQSITATNDQLATENKQLTSENQSLSKENEKLSRELTELKDLSGNAVNISRKNRELLKQNNLQKSEIEMQSAEVSRLQEQINSDQFYMGAGAILIGLILGLILPHMRPRQKSSEWA